MIVNREAMRASLAYRFFAFAYAFVSIHVARIYIHVSLFTCTIYLFIHPKATVKRFCESSLLRTNHSTLQILCFAEMDFSPRARPPLFPDPTRTHPGRRVEPSSATLSPSRAPHSTLESRVSRVSLLVSHTRDKSQLRALSSLSSHESHRQSQGRAGGVHLHAHAPRPHHT
jgi:hypothetical protein